MLIFRDSLLCAFMSLLYAGIELTFRVCMQVDTCWRDVFFFDFFLSSLVGITLGHFTCKYLQKRTQKWFGPKPTPSTTAAKIIELFHPNVWWNYQWRTFATLGNFMGVVWLLIITQISDINIFFLKTVLGIPSNHWLLVTRALLLAMLAMISVKEYYEFLNSRYVFRFYNTLLVNTEDFRVLSGYSTTS